MNPATVWDNLLSSLAHVRAHEPSSATANLQIVIDELTRDVNEALRANGHTDLPRWVRNRCRVAIEEISKNEWSKASLLISEAILAWEPAAVERWRREHLNSEGE